MRIEKICKALDFPMKLLDVTFLDAIQYRNDQMLGESLKRKEYKNELFPDIALFGVRDLLKDVFNVNVFDVEAVRSIGPVQFHPFFLVDCVHFLF